MDDDLFVDDGWSEDDWREFAVGDAQDRDEFSENGPWGQE